LSSILCTCCWLKPTTGAENGGQPGDVAEEHGNLLRNRIKGPVSTMAVNVAGVGPGDRSIMGNLSTEKCHQKLSWPLVTLPIRASDSANVRQRRPRHETPALNHGRVAAQSLGSFYPFWSTKIVRPIVSRICKYEFVSTNSSDEIVSTNCKRNCQTVSRFVSRVVSRIVESRTVQIVFSSVLNSVEDTLVECQLNTIEINKVFPFIFSSLVFSHYGR